MVQPIDYLSMIPQPDLGQALLGGLQAGAALRQVRDERAAQEQAKVAQEQLQADLQNALSNPTARNFAALNLKYPGMNKAFSEAYSALSKEQQDAEFGAGVQVYSALQNNDPASALRVVDENIAALENSGQDSSDLKNIRRQIETDPKRALGFVGLTLSATDPDRWGKIASEQREAAMAPANLTEAQAKAHKAAVDAQYAESNAVQEIEKRGWDIAKLQNDIDVSRQNARIAAIDANLRREENEVKRDQLLLKLADEKAKRDDAVRAKTAAVESSRSTIDNSIATIDRILSNPALNSVVGSVEGSQLYPTTLVGLIPGTDSADDRNNAIADIDTLKSQTFMTQLQQLKEASATGASGLGGVTEKEVDLLINGVQSLKTKQGETQFRKNLEKMQALLMGGRKRLAEKYGVPDTIPNTPDVQPSAVEIDALLQKYGAQ